MSQLPISHLQFHKILTSSYHQLINQSKNCIHKLISQNLYIDNQIKLLQQSPIHPIKLPHEYAHHSQFPYQTSNNTYAPSRYSELAPNFPSNIIQSHRAPHSNLLQNIRNAASNQIPIQRISLQSQSFHDQNIPSRTQFEQDNSVKTQNTIQKAKKHSIVHKKFSSGKLEDIPGNPIENRLVQEFFTNQFSKYITVNGIKTEQVNKKELLVCYVSWRLKVLPQQRILKLVSIQVILSRYINANLKQCENLRYTYSGMSFNSFDIVRQLKKVDLDNYRQKETRGGRSIKKKNKTIQQFQDYDDYDEMANQQESSEIKQQQNYDNQSQTNSTQYRRSLRLMGDQSEQMSRTPNYKEQYKEGESQEEEKVHNSGERKRGRPRKHLLPFEGVGQLKNEELDLNEQARKKKKQNEDWTTQGLEPSDEEKKTIVSDN